MENGWSLSNGEMCGFFSAAAMCVSVSVCVCVTTHIFYFVFSLQSALKMVGGGVNESQSCLDCSYLSEYIERSAFTKHVYSS
jgi:hypothetical protein